MEPNFSGYVSKANLLCADGRTIMPGAFKHQDGADVPLVYQHNHDDVNQVLGHVILSHKEDGTWGDVFLNDTVSGKNADALVKHGDIKKFSIWAKNLVERGLDVIKGDIQEVSLVLAGKNSGANIANYNNVLAHGGMDEDDTLLIIGGEIVHSDGGDKPADAPADAPADTPADAPADAPAEEPTVADELATLTDSQRTAVNAAIDDIVTEAVTEALTQAALAEEPVVQHDNLDSSMKGTKMSRNVFDRSKQHSNEGGSGLPELKHDDIAAILKAAKGPTGEGGGSAATSLKQLVRSEQGRELMHADTYGIDNIETLFPDAKLLMQTPTFVDRRQEWVKIFMNGTSHTPFSRVKTTYADITADEARARGYIKGSQKVDEVFPVFKRTTGPAMVYKRQKLDRQDIIDITDFDVVAWMKVEMRGKLDEEIARAALFGDNRPAMVGSELNPDKIVDPGGNNTSGDGIRAVVNDNDLYTGTFDVPLATDATGTDWNVLLDAVVEADEFYRGSGNKTGFATYRTAAKLLTIRDEFGHRLYRNLSEVASDMGVSTIVKVPTELFPTDVLLVVLDLSDYNFGSDQGGQLTLFDQFDIDFNQYKYLMEVYLSGALVQPFAAQVFKRVDTTSTLVTPLALAFTNPDTVEYASQTGVVYKRTDTGATLSADITLAEGESVTVEASPASGYYFGDNLDVHDSWTYEYGDPDSV
jgi:HK97 family phage prohead protease